MYTILRRGSYENDIKPTSETEHGMEGSSVTLSCNYSGSVDYLQWYRQYPRSAPQFLLYTTVSSNPAVFKAKPEDPRLSVNLNEERTRVDLEISSAEVTDSALYYCALLPTLTRDSPQYVLRRDRYSEESNSDEFKKKFDYRLNFTSSSVPLTIQRLQPSYSTLYYCALRSTVTTGDSVTAQKLRRVQLSDSAVYYCALRPTVTTGYTAPLQKHTELHLVICTEGASVTLSCSYDTSSDNILLYWYQQYPNQAPHFLLVKVPHKVPVNIPLIVDINPQRIASELVIKHLTLADTALYYCAFGKARTLLPFFIFLPNQHEVYGEEGSNVQLSCNYSSAYSVLCYKQYPGSAPQFLLFIHHASRTVVRAKPPYSHLTVKLNKEKTRVDLEISSAELRDSALYYYAVLSTVTHNSLTQHSVEYRPVTCQL
ncbi:unnamed protein product, partial [Coregonus sp. 'balchen']